MDLALRPGITIRRPRREVATIMFDPRQDASWCETFRVIDDDDAAPDDDEQRERVFRLLLRDIPLQLRIVSSDPERFIEFTADDPIALTMRQDMESIPEGALVRIRLHVTLRGLQCLFAPLIRYRLRRSLIADLEALKALVESSPARRLNPSLPIDTERQDAVRSAAEAPPPPPVRPAPAPPQQAAPAPIRRPAAPPPGRRPTPNW
jgi:hypothetical protein